MFVLISYDIADPKRLRRVAITMKNYGTRVQKSVFECLLTKELLERCEKEIEKIIESEEDSVRIYLFCEKCQKNIKIKGIGRVTKDVDVFIY